MAHSNDAFRWSCLGVAVVSMGFVGWSVNDLRLEIKQLSRQLNEDLPKILKNTKRSTETLAALAEDLKNVRNLAVGPGKAKDNSISIYGNDVLTFVANQDAKIAVEKRIGKALKAPVPAKEWVVGARREALYLSFRVRSKRELVEKLCKSLTGRVWLIEFEGQKPQPLLDWLKANHEPTKAAFTDVPKTKNR